MAATRITKHDVEMQRLRNSIEFRLRVVHAFYVVAAILATAVPLIALKGVIDPLAGRETVINANVVVSISVAISVAVNIAQYAKGASRKRRLKEMRSRVEDLEQRLGIVGGDIA